MGEVSSLAANLEQLVKQTAPELGAITEEESLLTRGPGTWSRRQILGHVIDSALNNLHRFIRAQHDADFSFPDYDQPFWVRQSGYQERSWTSLVQLWESLNFHVSSVIARIPPEKLTKACRIGENDSLTLEFIVRDYEKHLRHHLNQILDPEGSKREKHPPWK